MYADVFCGLLSSPKSLAFHSGARLYSKVSRLVNCSNRREPYLKPPEHRSQFSSILSEVGGHGKFRSVAYTARPVSCRKVMRSRSRSDPPALTISALDRSCLGIRPHSPCADSSTAKATASPEFDRRRNSVVEAERSCVALVLWPAPRSNR
jgi:hypothetical protein